MQIIFQLLGKIQLKNSNRIKEINQKIQLFKNIENSPSKNYPKIMELSIENTSRIQNTTKNNTKSKIHKLPLKKSF